MLLIKVDTQGLRNAANEIAVKISEMKAISSRIERLIGNIEATWHGHSSDSYVKNLRRNSAKIKVVCAIANEYRNFLLTSASKFEEIDRKEKQIIDKMLSGLRGGIARSVLRR